MSPDQDVCREAGRGSGLDQTSRGARQAGVLMYRLDGHAPDGHSRQQRPQGNRTKHIIAAAGAPRLLTRPNRSHHESQQCRQLEHGPSSSTSLRSLRDFCDVPLPDSPVSPRTLISSPRWDSLESRPLDRNPLSMSPTSPKPWRMATTPPQPCQSWAESHWPVPSSTSNSPARQFPLVGHNGKQANSPCASRPQTPSRLFSPQSTGGSRPSTAASNGNGMVGNFSRPRGASLQQWQQNQAPTYSDTTQPAMSYPPQAGPVSQPRLYPRSRGLSLSSTLTANTNSSTRRRPSNDYHSGSRIESTRAGIPTSNPTSNLSVIPSTSNCTGNDILGREKPWLTADQEEVRSSLRSQLSTATERTTIFTAAGTERSSVITKASSVTEGSIINSYARHSRTESGTEEGPSVEDVMGMYENGFGDDSDAESFHRRSRKFFDGEFDDATVGVIEPSGPACEIPLAAEGHDERRDLEAKVLEAMHDQLPLPRSTPAPGHVIYVSRHSRTDFGTAAASSSIEKSGLGPAFERMQESKVTNHDAAKSMAAKGTSAISKSSAKSTAVFLPTDTVPATASPPSQTISQTRPPPAAQPPIEPPEDPSSRDRYGFRKASSNVSREEYDRWNSAYTDYLVRRRKKWAAFQKDNSLLTDKPDRFPPRSAKTKRFIRKGIPPDWRGAAWFYYAGGPAVMAKHAGLYQQLVNRAGLDAKTSGRLPGREPEVMSLIIEDIEKDLHRTFPDNLRFKPPPSRHVSHGSKASLASLTSFSSSLSGPGTLGDAGEPRIISSLRRVLHAFALYNPRIGYCQSLNFLAGLLLLFVETEEHAFWLLNIITRVYLPGTHEMSLEGSRVDLGVLMVALKDSLPNIWRQIGGDELEAGDGKKVRGRRSKELPAGHDPNRLPAITLCMTAWFMSCFIGTLPIETVLRVWDVFFYEGSKTLFRIALTILKLGEYEIKAVKDPMEMFGVVQAFPRRLLDCNMLLESCFKRRNGIGHLSQDVVEQKRQERRDGIRKWKVQQDDGSEDEARDTNVTRQASTTKPATAVVGASDSIVDADIRRKGPLFGRRAKAPSREQMRAAEVM